MSTATAHRDLDEEIAFRKSRKTVFGGSDAPAVFGYSSYRNALDVYHEKTRPVREEDVAADLEEETIDIWRGNRNEADSVRLFLALKGYEGRHESRQIFAPDSERVAVHVDGTIYADPARPAPRDGTGVIEAKSPRAQTFARLVTEGIGARYLVQAQFNCAVTGRPWGALAFFCDHHDAGPVLPVEVDADPDLGRLMLERAETFMREHVEARIPPDPAAWSLAEEPGVTEKLVGRSGEYRVIEEPAFVDGIGRPLVERYRLQRDAKAGYEAMREEAQAWIEKHLDTDAVMLPSGDKIRIIRSDGRTYLDEKRLRASRPIDCDAFIRWMEDECGAMPSVADELAEHLELDFAHFEKQGAPSAHVRVYSRD